MQAEQEDEKSIEDLIVRVRADVIYLANELFAGTKIMSVSALCICKLLVQQMMAQMHNAPVNVSCPSMGTQGTQDTGFC